MNTSVFGQILVTSILLIQDPEMYYYRGPEYISSLSVQFLRTVAAYLVRILGKIQECRCNNGLIAGVKV